MSDTVYEDSRGWKTCHHGFGHVESREESEAALAAWAKKKGMKVVV